MNKTIKNKNGQTLAEFALTLPIMLLLIFTFFDFGRAIYYYSAISNAVREGARFAIVNKNENQALDGEIISLVTHYSIAVNVDPNDVVITYTGSDNEFVTIQAAYTFLPVTPFLGRLLSAGNTLTLTAETTMMLAPFAR